MSMGRGMGIFNVASTDTELTISLDQARENAQLVLDEALPGTRVDDTEADAFYGYYTLHILQDDKITGMLSVNGYTGLVWLHHWHGNFIAMTEHAD